MDFTSAKLKVNPDENWEPVKGSKEHHEIIALMKANGFKDLADEIRRAPRLVPVNTQTMKNPITRELHFVGDKKAMSKKEFLCHPSNQKQVQEHITNNAISVIPPPLIQRMSIVNLDLSGVTLDKSKRISKSEFLKLGNVKEYVQNHIARAKQN
jgi:hypothetical protein